MHIPTPPSRQNGYKRPLTGYQTKDFCLIALLANARKDYSFRMSIPCQTPQKANGFRHRFYTFRSALLRSNNMDYYNILLDFNMSLQGDQVIISNTNELMPFYANIMGSTKAIIPPGDQLLETAKQMEEMAKLIQAQHLDNCARITLEAATAPATMKGLSEYLDQIDITNTSDDKLLRRGLMTPGVDEANDGILAALNSPPTPSINISTTPITIATSEADASNALRRFLPQANPEGNNKPINPADAPAYQHPADDAKDK